MNFINFFQIPNPLETTVRAIHDVKPFKTKNRDKIYLDAPNPNLKKVVIEIFERQPKQ